MKCLFLILWFTGNLTYAADGVASESSRSINSDFPRAACYLNLQSARSNFSSCDQQRSGDVIRLENLQSFALKAGLLEARVKVQESSDRINEILAEAKSKSKSKVGVENETKTEPDLVVEVLTIGAGPNDAIFSQSFKKQGTGRYLTVESSSRVASNFNDAGQRITANSTSRPNNDAGNFPKVGDLNNLPNSPFQPNALIQTRYPTLGDIGDSALLLRASNLSANNDILLSFQVTKVEKNEDGTYDVTIEKQGRMDANKKAETYKIRTKYLADATGLGKKNYPMLGKPEESAVKIALIEAEAKAWREAVECNEDAVPARPTLLHSSTFYEFATKQILRNGNPYDEYQGKDVVIVGGGDSSKTIAEFLLKTSTMKDQAAYGLSSIKDGRVKSVTILGSKQSCRSCEEYIRGTRPRYYDLGGEIRDGNLKILTEGLIDIREIKEIGASTGKYELSIGFIQNQRIVRKIQADVVIFATGFQQARKEFLGELAKKNSVYPELPRTSFDLPISVKLKGSQIEGEEIYVLGAADTNRYNAQEKRDLVTSQNPENVVSLFANLPTTAELGQYLVKKIQTERGADTASQDVPDKKLVTLPVNWTVALPDLPIAAGFNNGKLSPNDQLLFLMASFAQLFQSPLENSNVKIVITKNPQDNKQIDFSILETNFLGIFKKTNLQDFRSNRALMDFIGKMFDPFGRIASINLSLSFNNGVFDPADSKERFIYDSEKQKKLFVDSTQLLKRLSSERDDPSNEELAKIAEFIRDRKIDPQVRNEFGQDLVGFVRSKISDKKYLPLAEALLKQNFLTQTDMEKTRSFRGPSQFELEQRDGSGNTPLLRAVIGGDFSGVQYLLERGAAIDAKDNLGRTSLMIAADSANAKIFRLLFEKNASLNGLKSQGVSVPALDDMLRAYDFRSFYNSDEINEILSLKIPNLISYANAETALTKAIRKGDVAATKDLLDRGAKVDLENVNSFLPLEIAIQLGNVKIIELLLEYGPVLNFISKVTRQSVQSLALSAANSDEVVAALSKKIPDLLFKDGETSLIKAIQGNDYAAAKDLLERGAKVDGVVANSKKLPLVLAIELGNTPLVDLLIQYKVSLNLLNPIGLDLQTLALQAANSDEVVSALSKIDPNLKFKDGDTLLMKAIRKKDFEAAKDLLARGARVNDQNDKTEETALKLAIEAGDEKLVALLLENNADIQKALGQINLSTIFGAQKNLNKEGEIKILNALIQKNPNVFFKDGETPLIKAVRAKDVEKVEELLNQGAMADFTGPKIKITPLMFAAQLGNEAIVTLLIGKSADVNADSGASRFTRVLDFAFQAPNSRKIVELLIKKDPNVKAKDGDTLLFKAVERKDLLGIKSLLEKGASVTSKNKGGQSVLDLAIDLADLPLLELLIKQDNRPNRLKLSLDKILLLKAWKSPRREEIMTALIENNPNLVDSTGTPLLIIAVESNEFELAKFLVEKGADVDKRIDESGRNESALSVAVFKENIPMIKLLVPKTTAPFNARYMAQGFRGYSIIDLDFLPNRNYKFETYMALASANPNLAINIGSPLPILILAVKEYNLEAVQLLIDQGANVEIRDYGGKTPLMYAAENLNYEMVELLVRKGADVNATNSETRFSKKIKSVRTFVKQTRSDVPGMRKKILNLLDENDPKKKGKRNSLLPQFLRKSSGKPL